MSVQTDLQQLDEWVSFVMEEMGDESLQDLKAIESEMRDKYDRRVVVA